MKVTAPLFSLDASGSIGGAIVASKWKGRNYMRRLVTPANPRSDGQVSNRAVMRFLSQAWANLTELEQAAWDLLAAQGNFSPFNAYVKRNMQLWTQWSYPRIGPDYLPVSVPATPDTLTATGGVGQISGTVDENDPNADGWGIVYYLNDTNDQTVAKTDLKVFNTIEFNDGDPISLAYVITGLEPGEYYVKAKLIGNDGGESAAYKVSALATVT